MSFHAPAVTMATDNTIRVLVSLVYGIYLSTLFCAALWAAEPGLVAVFAMCHAELPIRLYRGEEFAESRPTCGRFLKPIQQSLN